jgi:mannose-6-phosphate isomerase-like protein (cupin superfamily)
MKAKTKTPHLTLLLTCSQSHSITSKRLSAKRERDTHTVLELERRKVAQREIRRGQAADFQNHHHHLIP